MQGVTYILLHLFVVYTKCFFCRGHQLASDIDKRRQKGNEKITSLILFPSDSNHMKGSLKYEISYTLYACIQEGDFFSKRCEMYTHLYTL